MQILHSGQTGVERGAHRAATAMGVQVSGICPAGMRDEWGALPPEVAAVLSPSRAPGARNAKQETLALASALLILVPSRASFAREIGIAAIARLARSRGVPCEIADPTTPIESIIGWLPAADQLRLMITGPRGTRWPEGDRASWLLVTGMVMAISPDRELVIPRSRSTSE